MIMWVKRMLRTIDLPRVPFPERSERSYEIERAAREERERVAERLQRSLALRQEANGLWATDLLADRSHRAQH